MMQCLKERIEYSLNPVKTECGKYTSFYECTPEAVVEEFALAKRQYEYTTGRKQERGVIAYMIRQSFKPGEIEPEEANKLGYELAMRFTKGKHMFFVATHTDKDHVHNHIVFNSTTLDCTRKFKNFFLSGKAIQKLSDLICIETNLSVIEAKPYSKREKTKCYRNSVSKRDLIRRDIDLAMHLNPQNMNALVELLREKGYVFKIGKQIAIKGKDDQRYIKFDSLGKGYTKEDLEKAFAGGIRIKKKKKGYQKGLSLMIDIQEKIKEGKGGGYTHWAKLFNVKQMAETVLFLQEHDFESFEQLNEVTNHVINRLHEVSIKLKDMEKQISDTKNLRIHLINYSKTRDTYCEYKKAGYSKKYYVMKVEEIEKHKSAKRYFDQQCMENFPKIKEINVQISDYYEERKKYLEEYYKLKEEMKKYVIVRENVKKILEGSYEAKESVIGKGQER